MKFLLPCIAVIILYVPYFGQWIDSPKFYPCGILWITGAGIAGSLFELKQVLKDRLIMVLIGVVVVLLVLLSGTVLPLWPNWTVLGSIWLCVGSWVTNPKGK
jgi:hypothetical protein